MDSTAINFVTIVRADLDSAEHQHAVVALIDAYAADPMGAGAPLPHDVREKLIAGLRAHPTTLIYLAYVTATAVGIAVCFRGFSTFAARPLINIHDLAVFPTHRGLGIGRQLLRHVADEARRTGCCKVTLEVTERNVHAQHLYYAEGFVPAMVLGKVVVSNALRARTV